ncbi:MAG: tetratricopeptide repeat protein [Lachnospiraceae bacterium]|nr:tetratricopeptide repeat protein [Lachnospiraceae bacterium]
MKKKILIILYLFLLIIFGKFLFSYLYNEKLISDYNENVYSLSANNLKIANFYQPYIAYFNSGNIYYQKHDYDDAIKEYNSALNANPPKLKECPIRINLALAMIGKIPDDYDSPDNIDETILTLKEAREVLLEDGCATEDGDGHSSTAERLKKEIDDLIDELEEKKDNNNGNDDDGDDNQQDNNQNPSDATSTDAETDAESERENEIEEQLMQMQQEAYEDREEELQSFDDINIYMYDGDIW